MSALLSEFCTVQILAGPQNLSAYGIPRCLHFKNCKVLRVMQSQSGLQHFVLYIEVSALENVHKGGSTVCGMLLHDAVFETISATVP